MTEKMPTISYDDLLERNGITYKKFSNDPFNGSVEGRIKGTFKNGLLDGYFEEYFEMFFHEINKQNISNYSLSRKQ